MTAKIMTKSKVYLTYLNEQNDKIPLSFRDETSLNEHINKNKISNYNIVSISKVNSNTYKASRVSGRSAFVSYRNTTKRGIGG